MHKIVDGTQTHLDAAALIWARATAQRDGNEPASLGEARPVLARVLAGSDRSLLLVAVTETATPAAFAAIAPLADAPATAELHYLGVDPAFWGVGAAGTLLAALPGELVARGFSRVMLSVYADNERAVRLYERLGWRLEGAARPHPRTGKPELRYVLQIA